MPSTKRINLSSNQFSSDTFGAIGDNQRFTFKRKSYACSVLAICLFRFELLGGLITSSSGRISLIQFFITLAFLILPILYMFLFIGFYSKLGSLVIGRIVPVTNGVGCTMVMISVIEAVCEVQFACEAMMYFYNSFSPAIPWMVCDKDWGNDCIGLEQLDDITDNGKNSSVKYTHFSQLSAYKYRVYTLRLAKSEELNNANLTKTQSDRFWQMLDGLRLLYLLICIALLAVVTDLDLPRTNKTTNFFYCFYMFSIIIIIIVTLFYLTNADAVVDILYFNSASLIDTQTWFNSALYFLKAINLSNVSTVLIGSYLPLNAMADLQAFVSWIGIVALYMLGEFMTCLMRAAVASKFGMTGQQIKADGLESMMILYPMFLGSLDVSPHSFTGIYFFVMIVSSIYRVKLLLTCIYCTLADWKPIIRLYRFYIRIFTCLFLLILTCPICLVEIYDEFRALLIVLQECLNTVVLVIICTCILYIYGTQTLCDDHHFTYGNQPAIFFKVTLLMAPFVLSVFGALLFLKVSSTAGFRKQVLPQFIYVLFPVCLSPQIVGLFYITTYYLKRQDMAHLLKCDELWGDPSAIARKDRIIYHPRKETNYFRRMEVCKHGCLRFNKVKDIIVREEMVAQNEGFKMIKDEQKMFTDEEAGIGSESSYSLGSINSFY